MSATLLAKLKVKPKPKIDESIQIQLPKPSTIKDISIKTKILDKRDEIEFDRNAFLNKLNLQKSILPITDSFKEDEIQKLTIKPRAKKIKTKLKLKDVEIDLDEIKKSAILPDDETRDEKIVIKRKKRITKKPIGVIEGPLSMLQIGDEVLSKRLNKPDPNVLIRSSNYYMNNREIFVNFINSLFEPYKKDLEKNISNISCDTESDEFKLLLHQQIVRDYINLYTPYRGLLLYHGLGSGKTCSSIAIAEGMKTEKQVIIMTPASLRMNYIEELKKCGDSIYKKNQFWEFIQANEDNIETLSNVLSLSVEFIKKQGGAWLVNVTKPTNFDILTSTEKFSLDNQLNEMIRFKYKFINYNGLRNSHLKTLSDNYKKNPFDNSVIIVDEAHNFVSRIVNKINKSSKDDILSIKLYEYLMNAENCKIVLLTGTPIINYPNEIAILFNILRGKIKTWFFKLTINQQRKINQESFVNMFKSSQMGKYLDFIEYKPTSTTLVITRNPFGFVNKNKDNIYEGVNTTDSGYIDDETFVKKLTNVLKKNDITVNPGGVRVELYKALPDKLDDFKSYFIDSKNNVTNENLFKRRILGLTSYFRSAQEELMPKFEKSSNFHVVKIEMSDFQFGVYEEARIQERKLESRSTSKKKKKDDEDESVSTYRIFSRAFCNFVFPRPDIVRPMPNDDETLETAILKETADEDLLDAASVQDKIDNVDGRYEADELDDESDKNISYDQKIQQALQKLKENKDEYLTPDALKIYSPKFLNMLENIEDIDHKGLHLVYSQFRTLEGIGIFKLILEANGFVEFKLKKTASDKYIIDIDEKNIGKPTFALYTGTETPEEREIIRNVFNSSWNYLPTNIREQLETLSTNNHYGDIIKVLMITASGAEGISLKNVRYVHITEPYWHPVRIQQVIGRARRICSHKDLPEELQTVDVFLYLMTFSEKQLTSDESIELRLKDKSKIDNKTPLTSDEALYEIANIKDEVNKQILEAVKESSMDCAIHSKFGGKEQLKCFTFGNVNPKKFSYQPSISQEESDIVSNINKQTVTWKAVNVKIEGIEYALNKETGDVYDLDSYLRNNPIQIGKLIMRDNKYIFEKL